MNLCGHGLTPRSARMRPRTGRNAAASSETAPSLVVVVDHRLLKVAGLPVQQHHLVDGTLRVVAGTVAPEQAQLVVRVESAVAHRWPAMKLCRGTHQPASGRSAMTCRTSAASSGVIRSSASTKKIHSASTASIAALRWPAKLSNGRWSTFAPAAGRSPPCRRR